MDTVFRVAALYLFILLGLRVMGKREFSQLSPLELVTLLLIPELASQAALRQDFSITNAFVAIATLLTLVFLSSVLHYHSRTVAHLVNGSPTVLVRNGEFLEESMNRERVGPEEIFSEMHKSGIETLPQVKWAILETDGRISLVPFERAEAGSRRGPRRSPVA